jgi:choline dehydrogenase
VLLGDLGIPVVHASPWVGNNLQDHLQLRMVFEVDGLDTLNMRAGRFIGRAGMALHYALRRRGPMTMAPSQMGGFARSGPEHATANIEFHVQPLSLDKFGEPLHAFPAFTATACNLRPESRGQVRAKSRDPFAAPAIQPNYLAADADRRVAVEAIRLVRRLVLESRAYAPYQPREFRPGAAFATDAELEHAAGEIGTTIFHPVGTCRMGGEDSAVVDARLRVHGMMGLRVVDASIMPTITSGNTASPTVMIAEKAADMILADAASA